MSSSLEDIENGEEETGIFTLYEVATQPKRFPNSQAADKKLASDAAFLFSTILLLGEQQKAIGAPFVPPTQFTFEESITEETAGKVAHWNGPPVPLKD